MDNKYKKTSITVSLIRYHFIFCPRYKRKIFNIPGIKERFVELIEQTCNELNIEIISIECDEDNVHLFLSCLPTFSPSDIIQRLKSVTSRELRKEFAELSKMPSLWTKKYLVSTEDKISYEVIKEFLRDQRSRY